MAKIIEYPELKGTNKDHQHPALEKKKQKNPKPTLGLSLPWHNISVQADTLLAGVC